VVSRFGTGNLKLVVTLVQFKTMWRMSSETSLNRARKMIMPEPDYMLYSIVLKLRGSYQFAHTDILRIPYSFPQDISRISSAEPKVSDTAGSHS
jgi:hypothetical protein